MLKKLINIEEFEEENPTEIIKSSNIGPTNITTNNLEKSRPIILPQSEGLDCIVNN